MLACCTPNSSEETAPNTGSSALLAKRGRFGAEAPTKSLENEGDTSRGQAQITKSAEEPNYRFSRTFDGGQPFSASGRPRIPKKWRAAGPVVAPGSSKVRKNPIT